MNCRRLETRILPAPAVAGVLAKHYIEARLHTDAYDPEREAENQALQLEIEGGVGLPFYAAMDPATEEVLATFNESAKAIVDPGVLVAFFGDTHASHGEKVAAARYR